MDEVRADNIAWVRLTAAAPELLAALERVEWINDDMTQYCPWCGGRGPDAPPSDPMPRGHASTCIKQLALAKARGTT